MDSPFIWIVENLVKEKSYLALTDEIERQGLPLYKINGDFYKNDLTFIKNARVITNGSIEVCKLIKQHLSDCSPVTYSTFENYLCSVYYPYFESYLFNDNYIMASLESVNRRKWWFYGLMGKESTMFIRPDSGDKTFKADLIDIQDWDEFYDSAQHLKNSMVLVSTPKNVVGEWRFVVTKYKEILGVSSYRFQGLTTRVPSAPVGATEFVKEILNVGFYPDPVFCIDVVMDSDNNFWLMELTSFSSAGLYACKMENIVTRVKEIVMED
jgi:hypothetical protein